MMTLNDVKRDNRKKPTYYSQCSSNFNRTLFFIIKNLIFKKDDLIKIDDIKPRLARHEIYQTLKT